MKINLEKEISRLEKEIKKEIEINNGYTKKAIFMMTTANIYLKQIGKPEKYSWA